MADADWTKLFGPIYVGQGSPAQRTEPPQQSRQPQTAPPPPQEIDAPSKPPPYPITNAPPHPSLAKKAAAFTAALARFTAGGFRMVTNEVYQFRFAHCLPCEHYDRGLCKHCGCYLEAKVRMPAEACPLGKWPAESS